MTKKQLNEFRGRYCVASPFMEQRSKILPRNKPNPSHLYNYVCGQKPSKKNYRYILYMIGKQYQRLWNKERN